MSARWRDCIVTLIDLVGVKALALTRRGAGSKVMRRIHRAVRGSLTSEFKSIDRAYVWNDSILLLSFVTNESSYESALRDADGLKRVIDQQSESYAIAVKGQAFPPTRAEIDDARSRTVVVQASSWAMANCFEIERELKSLRKPWYVDSRIASRLSTVQGYQRKSVKLLPNGRRRTVYVFDGYLWEQSKPG